MVLRIVDEVAAEMHARLLELLQLERAVPGNQERLRKVRSHRENLLRDVLCLLEIAEQELDDRVLQHHRDNVGVGSFQLVDDTSRLSTGSESCRERVW